MKAVQFYVFHASRHGGKSETWVGPLDPATARLTEKTHQQTDAILRRVGNGPKACRTEVQPYRWDTKEWGEHPEHIEVCSPGCAACRHGYHDEVNDA